MRLRRLSRLLLIVGLLGLLVGILPPTAAFAASLTVTTCADAGTGSLRDAIATAASGASIGFQTNLSCTIALTSGPLLIPRSMTIGGTGATITVDGGCIGCDPGGTPVGGVTVFSVGAVTATIAGLTIQHGNNPGNGGGIANGSGGTLTVRDTFITRNNAGMGGGIFNYEGTLIVDRTTFEGNRAYDGGGIDNYNVATLFVTNATFVNNQAQNEGGAIDMDRQVSVTASTIANNRALFGGGGISNNLGTPTLTLTGSIIAGNTSPAGPDVRGVATDGGYNLIGSPAGGNGFVDGTNHDHVGTTTTPLDPKLSALGTFGGPTPTLALLPGSPALDAIPTGTVGCGTTLIIDQRGIARPQGVACDMGAFEYMPPLEFYPLPSPVRLLDTRPGQSACVTPGVPIGGAGTLALNALIGCTGIPSSAQAVVGNATVVNNATNSPAGFATLYPGGGTLPLVSNLNYLPGDVIPNSFTVGLGSGAFNVYASSTIHFIVDLSGYYAPPGTGGLYYHSLAVPVRLLDSRPGTSSCNARGAPLPAGGSINLGAASTCTGIPASAQAIFGNATVVNTTAAPGFATLYPGGGSLPPVSNLNYVGGQVVPNAFTVGVSGGNGSFNVYSTVGIDLVIDIAGYYDTNSSGLLFTPLANPIRWLDTRLNSTACLGGGGPHTGGVSFVDPTNFTCGGVTIPSGAVAITGNATVVADANAGPGFVTLFPGGTGVPNASNFNYVNGQVVPNAYIVGLGNGTFSDGSTYSQAYKIYASTTVDEIVDISGYFTSAAGSSSAAAGSGTGKAEPNTRADTKPGR